MTKELITVKEYCRRKKISDTAARKQINTNKIESVIFKDITYIIIDNNDKEKLKANVKLKNSKIREMEHKIHFYENQKETIIKLEKKIDKLEDKLEEQRDTKEALYEKVIGELTGQNKLLKMG